MEVIQPDQPKFIVAWNMYFLIPKYKNIAQWNNEKIRNDMNTDLFIFWYTEGVISIL